MSVLEPSLSEGWAHSTSDPITFQFPLNQVLTKRLIVSKNFLVNIVREISLICVYDNYTNSKCQNSWISRDVVCVRLVDRFLRSWGEVIQFDLHLVFFCISIISVKRKCDICVNLSACMCEWWTREISLASRPMHRSTYIERHKFQHSGSLFEIYDSHIFQFPLQTGLVQYPHYKPTPGGFSTSVTFRKSAENIWQNHKGWEMKFWQQRSKVSLIIIDGKLHHLILTICKTSPR